LPLALIAGVYRYVSGGQVESADAAYVEADKVGISTDVFGIVKEVAISESQHVKAGQTLYRFDDLLDRANAQVGMDGDALNALMANYRDKQSQIQHAEYDIDYFGTEFRRRHELLSAHAASPSNFTMARRNLQDAPQKIASLKQQLAAIAASLNSDHDGPVEPTPWYHETVAHYDGRHANLPTPLSRLHSSHRHKSAFNCAG
jgi:membrane fusion protein, multidrug efflux system